MVVGGDGADLLGVTEVGGDADAGDVEAFAPGGAGAEHAGESVVEAEEEAGAEGVSVLEGEAVAALGERRIR